ncbi:N-acetylmuramoyl-L-alanine amidase [Candidatus Parcubacteria bacterium]|nr:MAG: N-acetylmuramoyl-L-alanine amidase [Candidatus Parcubacteria bacterium]
MPKFLIYGAFIALFLGFIAFAYAYQAQRFTDTEVGFEEITQTEINGLPLEFQNWERPEGPLRVGVQVGHWQLENVPEELSGLRRTAGTQGGGKKEWEVALAIAQELQALLESKGVVVDLLPATIPPRYFADVFVSIHADGSTDTRVSGFKAAAPWRDYTGKSQELVSIFNEEYAKTTGMKQDSNISRRMRGYYAFNWRRYEHSIHPMTVAMIVETGFLTNPQDQRILINTPERPAQGIANTIFKFLDINN